MNLLDHAPTTVYAAWKHLIEPITVRKHNVEDVLYEYKKIYFVDHFDVPNVCHVMEMEMEIFLYCLLLFGKTKWISFNYKIFWLDITSPWKLGQLYLLYIWSR